MAGRASVNWAIHRQHFSRMTPVLDLMHALSYAYRAAEEAASDQAIRTIVSGNTRVGPRRSGKNELVR